MLLQHLYYDDGIEDASSPTRGGVLQAVELGPNRHQKDRELYVTPNAYRGSREKSGITPPAHFTPVGNFEKRWMPNESSNTFCRYNHSAGVSVGDVDAAYMNNSDRKVGPTMLDGEESHSHNTGYFDAYNNNLMTEVRSSIQSRSNVSPAFSMSSDNTKKNFSQFDRRLLELIAQREAEFAIKGSSLPLTKSNSVLKTSDRTVSVNNNHDNTMVATDGVGEKLTTKVRSALSSNSSAIYTCDNAGVRSKNDYRTQSATSIGKRAIGSQTPIHRKHMVNVESPARDRLLRAKQQEDGRRKTINKLLNFGYSSRHQSVSQDPKDAYLANYYAPLNEDDEGNRAYRGRSGSSTMKSREPSRSSFMSYTLSSSFFANPLFRPPTLDGLRLVPTRVLTDTEKHVALSAIQIVLDITSKYLAGESGTSRYTASRPVTQVTSTRRMRFAGKSEGGNYIMSSRGATLGGWEGFITRCNYVRGGNYLQSLGVVRRRDRQGTDERGDYYHYKSTTSGDEERANQSRKTYEDDNDLQRHISTTNLTAYNVLKHIAASALSTSHGILKLKSERSYGGEHQDANIPNWAMLSRTDLERVLHVLGQHFDKWGSLDPFTLEYYVVFSCCDYLSKGGCGGSSGIGGQGGLGIWRPKAILLPNEHDEEKMLLVVSRRKVADLLEEVLCPIVELA